MRRGLLLWLAIGGAHARVRGAARRLSACDDGCCGERTCVNCISETCLSCQGESQIGSLCSEDEDCVAGAYCKGDGVTGQCDGVCTALPKLADDEDTGSGPPYFYDDCASGEGFCGVCGAEGNDVTDAVECGGQKALDALTDISQCFGLELLQCIAETVQDTAECATSFRAEDCDIEFGYPTCLQFEYSNDPAEEERRRSSLRRTRP